jgi:predicted amidohydrolase
MRVALVQMKVTAGDVAGNRRRGTDLARAAAKNAEVVVLPEIWTTGFSLTNLDKWAEQVPGPTFADLAAIARDAGAAIIAGSVPRKTGGRIYNNAIVIDAAGNIAADYQKLHLCSYLGEDRYFAPGNKRVVFDLGGTKAGLAVCYDLRFPELFRALAIDGAQIIFIPAEWTASRARNWRVLNQARAIDNQIYICAVNCVGRHREFEFHGHSMVVAPDGDIIAEGGADEEIIYCQVEPAMIETVRAARNVWNDRRTDMYD